MPNQRGSGSADIIYPTTVTLVVDPNDKLKMFFCFNCQTPYAQYKGNVLNVGPGLSAFEPYVLKKCKNSRCPMVYSFLPIVEMSKKYMLEA